MGCLLKQGGGLYERLRVGAVVLAAGEGSRMGSLPKCMLRLQGVPLINRHLIALSGGGIDEVVVVTGYHHAEVEPAVEAFPVTIVRNPARSGSAVIGTPRTRGLGNALRCSSDCAGRSAFTQ